MIVGFYRLALQCESHKNLVLDLTEKSRHDAVQKAANQGWHIEWKNKRAFCPDCAVVKGRKPWDRQRSVTAY